jgi:selenocysteine-specific elongation factor
MIVATAGHVDHGKTSLIKALTGTDTDRLAEEKRRGLTIDLGFAYLALPGASQSGTGTGTLPIGFIDVPGHERFIRNMVCGVAGIDLALLVIAADDGPMPQTREHLAILDLLGVGRGIVALTKTDRASPARITDVSAAITELVAPTTLAGAPILPVSSVTGEGIEALRAALIAEGRSRASAPAGGNFRLAVDRRFDITGAGLVVTGTVFAGTCRVGDQVRVQGHAAAYRVRSIRVQSETAEAAAAGQRAALNLTGPGLTREVVTRGDWIVTGAVPAPQQRLDVRLSILPGEASALTHWTPVHVHLGAAETTGRVALLTTGALAPGASGLAQLVLDTPLGAAARDRLIIRDQSARRTIGGGYVIDLWAPRRGRARPQRLAELEALDTADHTAALAALSAVRATGVAIGPFAAARNLTDTETRTLRDAFAGRLIETDDGPRAFSSEAWEQISTRITDALEDFHRARPDQIGPGPGPLLYAADLSPLAPAAAPLVAALEHDGVLVRERLGLRRPQHQPGLRGAEKALWDEIASVIEAGGNRPATLGDIAAATQHTERRIEQLLLTAGRHGLVHRLSKTRYITQPMYDALADVAWRTAETSPHGAFDARAFRDASGIGRNMTIEVLEYFDRQGLTTRRGDLRVIRQPAGTPPQSSRNARST